MANYTVDKKLLDPYIPAGTEIDLWNDTCYLSLVGFMFLNTRVKGLRIPFHSDFEEVNLRFYVRYKDNGEWKRGVVFLKELVPKPILAFVANTVYKENYEAVPMKHLWEMTGDALTVEYQWKKKQWNSIRVTTESAATPIAEGSEEEFITEHYWGYVKVNSTKTLEYGVEHPRWNVYKTIDQAIDVDFEDVYGTDFSFLENATPMSVFLAEGSKITVKEGHRIARA